MWKNRFLGVVFAGLFVLGLSASVLAQNNWGQNLTGNTESLTGTVISIDLVAPSTGLQVRVGEEILTVELGPTWFVGEFSVNVGDEVTVVGERTSGNTFVAYSVSKNQNGNTVTLTLRDANGKPVWGGTPGPKTKNQYRNRNRVTLRDGSGNSNGNGAGNGSSGSGNGGSGNAGNGNASGQGHQSGPQDGSGNQWGREQNQAGREQNRQGRR
ncbi:MAG: hypothetical protein ABDK94_03905 [Atribacterota bacterium]